MKTEEVKRIYNDIMPEKFGADYEYNRWFKTSALKTAYAMTKLSIERRVICRGRHYKNVLELGPGAGTWSKLLPENKFAKHLDVLDISSTMLSLAKNAMKNYTNTSFFERDFLDFHADKKYDFFFSSRVFEYLPDKEKAVSKISEILLSGGKGFIITKTPKYFINKLLGRKVSELHRGQISPRELKRLFRQGGFSEIKLYPVTMSFPFFKSAALNMFLYKIFGRFPLNPVSALFSESYSIQFTKK